MHGLVGTEIDICAPWFQHDKIRKDRGNVLSHATVWQLVAPEDPDKMPAKLEWLFRLEKRDMISGQSIRISIKTAVMGEIPELKVNPFVIEMLLLFISLFYFLFYF